ncbi:MAG: TetR/AcrR family transcriptional regulator [Rhizobiaceae bacterium]|nr:TetR/AcrR family transcriptional regulator [Rhizobiaceae bacterium]
MTQIITEIRSIVENPKLVHKRRRQITETATKLFATKGFHSTTIRDIADTAKVSIGLIYQYVEDKDDLLFLALAEAINSYSREIPKALDGITDPLERFRACFTAYCIVMNKNHSAAVLGYRESKSLSPERLKIIKMGELETNKILEETIADCVKAGVFKDLDVNLFNYTCICLAHSWPLSAWRLSPQRSIEEYIDGLLDILLPSALASPANEAGQQKTTA